LNDPVYGFITIPDRLIFDLIQHPYFQRLRRITQLGLSSLVYPGANHHRFHHALGASYLMTLALDSLQSKGHEVTEMERQGAIAAILLHDMGHAPFSHALERDIVTGIDHEHISLMFMERLNKEMDGALDTCISIFKKEHPKKFLGQLISGQLDVDRLDYLKRDSFYTGVSEGVVGSQRIIKMLDVHEGEIVVEEKGIYSIENFLVARRLMYWQVYLHKTVIAAEFLLVSIVRRARELFSQGEGLFASPALKYFLTQKIGRKEFEQDEQVLHQYASLDDHDVLGAIKVWTGHKDKVLSELSTALINRRLPKIRLSKTPFTAEEIELWKEKVKKAKDLSDQEVDFYITSGKVVNNAYDTDNEHIHIKYKDGRVIDVAEASDTLNISALSSKVEKYFLMVPRD
jgi:HD superfamily phosphohydrolase